MIYVKDALNLTNRSHFRSLSTSIPPIFCKFNPHQTSLRRLNRAGADDMINFKDPITFQQTWEANYESLYWIAYKIIDRQQEAEDIVTESFMKLLNYHAAFNHSAAVQYWLRLTTRNAAINLLKQQEYRQHEVTGLNTGNNTDNNDPDWINAETISKVLEKLYAEIEALPEKNRDIFKKRFIDQLSNDQIAEQLGIKNQSVRNHIAEALKSLRLSMERYRHLLSALLIIMNQKN
jgi:RNA polymerase sigma factor (sigma-70 family)